MVLKEILFSLLSTRAITSSIISFNSCVPHLLYGKKKSEDLGLATTVAHFD